MADIGENQERSAWNRCGDMLGVLPFDSFVVFAVHDPY